MRTADYDKIGLLPLRHHGDATNLWTRSVLYAATVEERDKKSGRYELGSDTVGDVNCALRFGKASRDIVGWAFCWPTVAESPQTENSGASSNGSSGPYKQPGGSVPTGLAPAPLQAPVTTPSSTQSTGNPSVPGRGQYAYIPADFDSLPVLGGKKYPADSAFASIHTKGTELPGSWPSFPKGYYGLAMAGTEHKTMLPVVLSGDPRLVAVNFAGKPSHSTTVVDTDGFGRIDDRRHAPIHSVWRVILEPTGSLGFGPRNPIAWNFRGGGQDDTAGFGLFYDRADIVGKRKVTVTPTYSERVADKLQPSTETRLQITRNPGVCMIGAAAHIGSYGPLHPGSRSDKHIFGQTKDKEPICSGHIHTDSYFYSVGDADEQDFDAPLEFQLKKYPNPGPLPMISRVHLTMDHGKTHPWVQGQKPGLWRWHAEFAMGVPPSKRPTPTTPPPTTPPTTGPPPPPPPTTPPNVPLTPGMPGYSSPSGGGVVAGFAGGAGIAAILNRGRDSWFPDKPPPYRDYGQAFIEETSRYTRAGTRQQNDPPQNFLRVYSETAYPALLFIPQELHPRAADLRRSPRAPGAIVPEADEAPVVGRMEAWGAWRAGDWVTSGLAGRTKYRRLGAGGVLLTPPQVDLSDSGSTYAPAGVTRTAFYFALAPSTYFGAGLPDLLTGGLKTGYRWGHDGAGLMKFEHLSSAGVATEVLGFNASKQLRVLEGGGTLLTFSGTLADGEYLKRSGNTLVGGSGGGSGSADDASSIIAHQSFGVR